MDLAQNMDNITMSLNMDLGSKHLLLLFTYVKVKFFSMDLVLSTYLANIESLTSYSIKTAVKEFAFVRLIFRS